MINEFKKTGALEGHFQLSSGLYSTVYLQCARVLQFPEKAVAFAKRSRGSLRKRESSWLPRRRLAGS